MTFELPEPSELSKALSLISSTLINENCAFTYKELYEEGKEKHEKAMKEMEEKHKKLYNERREAAEENLILKMKLAARLGIHGMGADSG